MEVRDRSGDGPNTIYHIYLIWTTCLLRLSERFPGDPCRCGRDKGVSSNLAHILAKWQTHVVRDNVGTGTVAPGFLDSGEAGCGSAHGPNRLRANSFLELVVFCWQAADTTAVMVKPNCPPLVMPANGAKLRLHDWTRFGTSRDHDTLKMKLWWPGLDEPHPQRTDGFEEEVSA